MEDKVVRPTALSRIALEKFVTAIQEELFLDSDSDGNAFWNMDKDTDAEDIQQFVLDRLHEAGLYPEPV